ncbi:hypothetical protein M8J76_007451 [Diaphorina citri]|nr:hypothetical protein M8J76_007451 [Diaphorina citri]
MSASSDQSSTRHNINSLLITSQIFGLFPTSVNFIGIASLLNYTLPLLQFTLLVAIFYWVHDEVANFKANSLSSTLISVAIMEFILAGFTLVHAVTKTKYIDHVSRNLDQVNQHLTHLEDNPAHLQSERKLCLLQCGKLLTMFFLCYLGDLFVIYYVLDVHLLFLLSISYWVHLRLLLLSLHLFTFLSLIQTRYVRLNTKLAQCLTSKSVSIFHILPQSIHGEAGPKTVFIGKNKTKQSFSAPQSTFISHRQYKELALAHNILSECCAHLNVTFSPLVCFLLTHHIVLGVLSLYWIGVHAILYYQGGDWEHSYVYLGAVALLNVKICAHIWFLLSQYSTTQGQSEETVRLLNKLFIMSAQTKVNQELRHVRDQLRRHNISFSPYGLFELDQHFFYTFITIIITYWVILIQFQV